MTCPLLPTEPVLVEKIWGGDRMGPRMGEAWHVADLENGQSTHLGEPLSSWVARHGRDLIGTRARDDHRFPLLLKLIDAADDLSVQVHPSRAAAAKDPGAHPKDETWLILEKDEGARVLHGFRDGVDRASFAKAVEDGHPEDLLRSVPVEPGDVVRVVPGTMHAIGRGTFLLELQEPSDTTYRVWDFGRLGLDGKPREIHTERALAVATFGEQPEEKLPPAPLGDGHDLLVDAPSYRLERLRVDGARELQLDGGGPLLALVLDGDATFTRGDEVVPRGRFETLVIPASSAPVTVTGCCTLALGGLGGAPLFG
jgi:mannose-6-phosphate isomerase